MSKSRRKTPIFGIAGSSEKKDKRVNNRKLRRKCKSILSNNPESDELLLPLMNEISDIWNMSKDGKFYFDTDDKEYYRK